MIEGWGAPGMAAHTRHIGGGWGVVVVLCRVGISARRGGAVHTDAEEEPRGWPPPNGARRWHSPRWSGGRAERATDRGKKIRRTAQRTAATVEAVKQEPWWPIHEPHAAAARSCIDIVI